jgi:uncharacterized protein YceH (UPF0502 family)
VAAGPLVTRLARQVGYKEVRYAHLLAGELVAVPAPAPVVRDTRDRLEAEVADLGRQFADFKRQFE